MPPSRLAHVHGASGLILKPPDYVSVPRLVLRPRWRAPRRATCRAARFLGLRLSAPLDPHRNLGGKCLPSLRTAGTKRGRNARPGRKEIRELAYGGIAHLPADCL